MPIYWIDAGVLITAKNYHYKFDMVPGFWTFIDKEIGIGNIRMPKIAYEEVIDGNDQLTHWCKTRKHMEHFCVKPDKAVQHRFGQIANYVYDKYKQQRHQASEFLKGADGWLVAHALETGGFVVTEERMKTNKSKIKIPTVAKAMGAHWKNTFDMCSALNARF